MIYSLPWLIEFSRERRIKYVHFWGHQPAANGNITSSCFSQWWPAKFVRGNEIYKTAEHFMMAEKARLFNNAELSTQIINCGSPGEAKKLGRTVAGFDESIWIQRRSEIVVEANLLKFSQHKELRKFLLDTGDRVLVEASPVDAIWGIGLPTDHKHAGQPEFWRGLNLLGFALMEVRDVLRQ